MTTDDKPVVLEVQDVTKRFGPVTALRDVNVQLRAGEVLGLDRRQRRGQEHAREHSLRRTSCG